MISFPGWCITYQCLRSPETGTSAPIFSVARRAPVLGFCRDDVMQRPPLFNRSFPAAAVTTKAYAFAPSSGKPISHIIPLYLADCANVCMKNTVEIVAAAAFRCDSFIVAGVFQTAVTISFGHTPLSHIRTIILNSNTFRAYVAFGLCECDHNKTHWLRQQRLPNRASLTNPR